MKKKVLLEVGINIDHSNTCHLSNKRSSDVIFNNLQFSEPLGLKTWEDNKSLPLIYWMPKLHFTSSPARFIKSCI